MNHINKIETIDEYKNNSGANEDIINENEEEKVIELIEHTKNGESPNEILNQYVIQNVMELGIDRR